jgi:cyclic pyranopterin phosphate synthase
MANSKTDNVTDASSKNGTTLVADTYGRRLRDLRISVTDRCNFRCVYCMPKEIFGGAYPFLARKELLSFEEISRLARLFAAQGVQKIRLTGGEPLVRKDLDKLIAQLSAIPGIEDISLTTNGSLLTPERAQRLYAAGLQRITISLDAIDDETFRRINDVSFPVKRVLAAVDAAHAAGMAPVKVNMVVKKGMNAEQILPMAEYFRSSPSILRFIEFMDVGNANGWKLDDVVSAREIVDTISAQHPLVPASPNYDGEVAARWKYADGSGEIGVISSVTQPFCSGCTRARLSAEGSIYTCLFASSGYDLRAPMRAGESDDELNARIRSLWGQRDDRYSQIRTEFTDTLKPSQRKVEMSYIGG